MADEDNKTEETVEAPAAEETPAVEEAAAVEETAVEETAVEETAAPDEPVAEAPAAPAEPVVVLTPKERRVAKRTRQAAKRPAGQPRTPEERQAERDERRKQLAAERRRYRAKQKEKRAATRTEAQTPEELQAPEHGPGRPKVRQGIVISDKADKTITVRIDVARRHRRYQKIMRSSTTLHAHDERNDAHTGDTVRVIECRPMSRTKRWRLDEVLERAK